MIQLYDLLSAYFDCRKHKRKTDSSIEFEMDYESKLMDLHKRINNKTYIPGKSICFVVKYPRYREVFAALFEDRIVHHYIAKRLEPLFEECFTDRSFNCRKEKGQLYGISLLYKDIKDCSEGYTSDCYVMKLDLKGFFMSIDKKLIADKIDRFIRDKYQGEDIAELRYVCRIVIEHRPELNCERHSPSELWDHLPPNKSLFTNGDNLGLAIGNLFSQMFANFLLNDLDYFVMNDLGFKHMGRYVDDMYIVDKDKSKMLRAIPKIRHFLKSLGLQLNEKKFYLQHYTKGISFIGSVVKKDRIYTGNRSVNNFKAAVRRLNKANTIRDVYKCVCSINSYLGLLRHADGYAIRRGILSEIDSSMFKYIYIKGRFEVLAIKKKYVKREIIKKNIARKELEWGKITRPNL